MSIKEMTVQLPQFEGPLALLLYLIRKEEMDIMDIQIHKITSQYLAYIKLMKDLDLEVAGEFVAMSATLIQIKSRMLLPQYDESGEVIEGEDPRKELVQKLLEYQKYQEAARSLYERPLLGRDVWSRGVREKVEIKKEEDIFLGENPIFSLITTWRWIMKSVKKTVHQVSVKLQSVASRIGEIRQRLLVGARLSLSELIEDSTHRRSQVLVTFLSILELGKMGVVSLFQSGAYQEIYIEVKKEIQAETVSSVEEYDNLNSSVLVEALIHEVPSDVYQTEEDLVELVNGEGNEVIATDEEIILAEKELNNGEVS